MESWFRDREHQNELVLLSEHGFTNDQLAIQFLRHFIRQTDSGTPPQLPPQPPTLTRTPPPTPVMKLLLMDNHGSHITPEFIDLATRNNIIPFTFPAHLTHCIQPCDVGIFQAMKHWHNKAIQHALETFDFEYSISSFLRDLPVIRTNTLKKSTIRDAFMQSGIWPVNAKAVLDNMSKYIKVSTPEPAPLSPQLPPVTPHTTHEFRAKWSIIQPKLQAQLSSPSQRQFDSINRGLEGLLDTSDRTLVERDMLYIRVSETMRKKPTNRYRLRQRQQGGELTAEYAQAQIAAKDQERRLKYTKKVQRARRIAINKEKKVLHAEGVWARKMERLRRKWVKSVGQNDIGASHLQRPFEDPETPANIARIYDKHQSTVPVGFEAGDLENMFNPVEIASFHTDTTNTTGSISTPKPLWEEDFIPLDSEDSVDSDDSGDSEDSEDQLSIIV
jgi:hypothetical protein